MTTTTLKIQGMSCEHCVKHVKEVLESLTGVLAANVSLGKGVAVVEHGDELSQEAMRKIVEEAGYEVV